MKVHFKKITDNAVIPSYAKPGDTGLDLTATSMEFKHGFIEYGTGIAVEIPEGYFGMLVARSSITNTPLMLANGLGVIDSGYRSELRFRFKKAVQTYPVGFSGPIFVTDSPPDDKSIYKVGDRIGQLIILPYPTIHLVEVKELNDSVRGEGGFGSTN